MKYVGVALQVIAVPIMLLGAYAIEIGYPDVSNFLLIICILLFGIAALLIKKSLGYYRREPLLLLGISFLLLLF